MGRQECWQKKFCEWEKITIKQHRYYIVGKIAFIFAISIHAVWIPLFFMLGATKLAFFNFFSVVLFGFCLHLNRKRKCLTSVAIAMFEVVIHQTLAVIFLGWDTGFQYYIFSVLMLPFLIAKPRIMPQIFMVGFCMASFMILEIVLHQNVPVYTLDSMVIHMFNVSNIFFAMMLIIVWSYYFNVSVNAAEYALELERERAENLLQNILPETIADRLKVNCNTIADGYSTVTVLFLDIVHFTEFATQKTPKELVKVLNCLFCSFDDIVYKYKLEKIKTIGDEYMVAAGVPESRSGDAQRIALFALEAIEKLNEYNNTHNTDLEIRIGINTGPVVAGVIGKRKFSYDLWGDAVNIASRMESHGESGRIHVSQSTFELLKDEFIFEERGKIHVKGKGKMHTWFLVGKK